MWVVINATLGRARPRVLEKKKKRRLRVDIGTTTAYGMLPRMLQHPRNGRFCSRDAMLRDVGDSDDGKKCQSALFRAKNVPLN